MKTLLTLGTIAITCLLLTGILLTIAFTQAIEVLAPTTYETGLYLESDQLQKTIEGKELQ